MQALDSETGHLRATEVERTCEVDIALRWGIGYDTTVQSFVNIIATPKGGTHVTGFEQAVLKTLRAAIDKNARKLKVGAKDGAPKGRRSGRHDRRHHRALPRAPVRGAD